jgi:hypothetical protein
MADNRAWLQDLAFVTWVRSFKPCQNIESRQTLQAGLKGGQSVLDDARGFQACVMNTRALLTKDNGR